MSDAPEFTFGATVACEDGECGTLDAAIVDHALRITHLVVASASTRGSGRLVPAELVASAGGAEVRLRSRRAQFDALDSAEGVEVRSATHVDTEARDAELGGMGPRVWGPRPMFGDRPFSRGSSMRPDRRAVTEDHIPGGEGEVAHGQPVHASDGPIGHVEGLRASLGDLQITQVLLAEGHLWGAKEVAIPADAVRFVVDDGVYLNLTKREVGDLPSVG